MIGVATSDLRNQSGEFNHSNSMCILAWNGRLFANGGTQFYDFKLKTGDKVLVRRN
jgi:hypothetical protein